MQLAWIDIQLHWTILSPNFVGIDHAAIPPWIYSADRHVRRSHASMTGEFQRGDQIRLEIILDQSYMLR